MMNCNSNVLLSIVVPVYNVERYLGRCIDSFAFADSDVFEVILVDDGSADGSAVICDRFASEHENVRVLHQDNSGVSAARNAGLELAVGEYIWFVDGDDLLADGAIGKNIQALEALSPDLLCFAETLVDSNGSAIGTIPSPDLSKGVANGPLVCGDYLYPHSHIFRKSVAAGLRFDTGLALLEDRDFFYRLWLCAGDSVISLDESLYCYRSGGAATSLQAQTIENLLGAQRVARFILDSEMRYGRPNPAFESYVLFTSMALSSICRAFGMDEHFNCLRDELIGYGMLGQITSRSVRLKYLLITRLPGLFVAACKVNFWLKAILRKE